jgi:hypothetical protein
MAGEFLSWLRKAVFRAGGGFEGDFLRPPSLRMEGRGETAFYRNGGRKGRSRAPLERVEGKSPWFHIYARAGAHIWNDSESLSSLSIILNIFLGKKGNTMKYRGNTSVYENGEQSPFRVIMWREGPVFPVLRGGRV